MRQKNNALRDTKTNNIPSMRQTNIVKPLLVFGDSYTRGLYPEYRTRKYFKPEAIHNCKGVTLFKLSLESYCKNEIDRKAPRRELEYIPMALSKTDTYESENNYVRDKLREWDNIVNTFKDKDVDVMILIGHVDLYSLYYKGDDEYKTNFETEFIINYTKLLTRISNILPRSHIYVISMCPFLLETGNIVVPGDGRNSDFEGMRNRTISINNRLRNLAGEQFFVDTYSEMWDQKKEDYKFELYNTPKAGYKFDSHVKPYAFINILREKLTLTKKFYKKEVLPTHHNIHRGGGVNISTSIYVVFIIILLFLYFIYVYQENIYSVIYNGRNTLCNSVYPSICISKG